ncbi:MAG: tetratricopeptide repeat protein, partial [Pseudomonadota bacterium]
MIRGGAFSLLLLVSAATAAADEGLAVPAEFDGQQDIETAQTAITPTPSAQDQSDFAKGLVCPEGVRPAAGTAELSDEEFSDLTINWDRALRSNQTNQALAFAEQVIPESRARAAQAIEVARHAEYLLAYARVLFAVQRGPEAVQITCEASFLFAKELGPGHQNTMNARVMHAQALAATNDLENAEPLFREHVASVEASAPATHPELLAAKATLALVRAQRGFAQEALQTLSELEAKLPEETPWQNRAILVNAEATILEQDNDPDTVEQFYERRFAQHTGEGQNDLAAKEWLLNRRAGWYGFRGQPEKAVEVIDQRLALYSGIFDPKSAAVLSALHAKASLLRIIPGRGNEAMEIAKSNLAAWETNGSAATATYAPRALVAELLMAARDYGAAIALFEENVELQKQSLPPGSPGILEAQRKQAIALQATGKFTSARQLLEAIVPQYAETLGPTNYLTIQARIDLAKLYEETGRLEKAERLASEAFSDSITYLGHRNPATGAASLVLSGIYLRSGRSQEALILSQRLMDLWASDPDKTGDGYFYQLTSHASALFNAGRRDEGIELSGHAVALARESFGVGVNLITGLTGHARTLSLAGRSEEAEPFAAEAFQLAQDSFGPSHFATRGALEVYVFVAQSSGQGEQALRLYDRYKSEIVDDVGVGNLEYYLVLLQYGVLEASLGQVESAHNRFMLIEEATRNQDDLLYKVLRNMGLLFLGLSASELGDQEKGLDAISQAEELTEELYANGMLPGNARTFPAVYKAGILIESEDFSGAENTLNNMLKVENAFPSGIAEYDFMALGIHTAARLNLAGREAASVEPAIALAKLYRDTRAALGFDPRLLNGNQIQSTTMPNAMQTIANAAYEARDIPNLEVPPLDLAFEALQNATLDQSSLAIAKTASLRAAERANVGELAVERLQLIDLWRSVNQGLAQSLTQVQSEAGASGARSLRLQRAGIETRLAEIDQILESDFPEYYNFIRPTPLSPEAASDLMSPSEAALLWVPSEFGTHVMVVTSDGLRWHRSDMTE